MATQTASDLLGLARLVSGEIGAWRVTGVATTPLVVEAVGAFTVLSAPPGRLFALETNHRPAAQPAWVQVEQVQSEHAQLLQASAQSAH
jgi:hypothetical protein